MATINAFEDLEVWKVARELAKDIYTLTRKEAFSRDYSLKDQINRAAGSIMDNIAEGFERDGNREFIQFLYIAKGSAGEVRSQLHRALDHNLIDEAEFESSKGKVLNVSQQLAGFTAYLRKSEIKGTKFAKEPDTDYHTNFES